MNKNDFVSTERLYLDKDNNVVKANDPNKLTLLVAEGGSLSAEEAAKYGLVKDEAKADYEPPVREATEDEEKPEAELQAKEKGDAEDESTEPKTVNKAPEKTKSGKK